MLKCIAIDDEPLALRQITAYISKIPYLELTATFNNAIEAQAYLAGQPVDLIFVDINMPDLTGVDFVRSLTNRPMVIFTTAYSEYAIEGFKLDAVDYLLKPFGFADFSRSAAKAHALYELRQNQRSASQKEMPEAEPKDKEYLSVKADYKVSLVRIADIVYLESEGEYVRMHLADGSTITTLFRLKNMEAETRKQGEERARVQVFLTALARREKVEVSAQEVDMQIMQMAREYKQDFRKLRDALYQNGAVNDIQDRMVNRTAMSLLFDKAQKGAPAEAKAE